MTILTHKISLRALINIYYCTHSAYLYNNVNKVLRTEYNLFFTRINSEYRHENFMSTDAQLTDFEPLSNKIKKLIEAMIKEQTVQDKLKTVDLSVDRNLFNIADQVNQNNQDIKNEFFSVTESAYNEMREMFLSVYQYISERWAFTIQRESVFKLIPEEHHEAFSELHREMNMKRMTGSTDYSVHLISEEFKIDETELKKSYNLISE